MGGVRSKKACLKGVIVLLILVVIGLGVALFTIQGSNQTGKRDTSKESTSSDIHVRTTEKTPPMDGTQHNDGKLLPFCLHRPQDLLFSIGGVNYKLDKQKVRYLNYVPTCHFIERNFISVEDMARG